MIGGGLLAVACEEKETGTAAHVHDRQGLAIVKGCWTDFALHDPEFVIVPFGIATCPAAEPATPLHPTGWLLAAALGGALGGGAFGGGPLSEDCGISEWDIRSETARVRVGDTGITVDDIMNIVASTFRTGQWDPRLITSPRWKVTFPPGTRYGSYRVSMLGNALVMPATALKAAKILIKRIVVVYSQ